MADHSKPQDGPMQDRRTQGVVSPECPVHSNRTDDTPDQQGIEIDHEKNRSQDKLQ